MLLTSSNPLATLGANTLH